MTATAPSEAEILQANAAFYEAFTRGDVAAMVELWAVDLPVTCVHPMTPARIGRREVLASWRQILATPPPAGLRCEHARVHVLSADVALVTCYARDGQHPAHLVATNVFARERGRWRMVHHQAGPLGEPLPQPAPGQLVN